MLRHHKSKQYYSLFQDKCLLLQKKSMKVKKEPTEIISLRVPKKLKAKIKKKYGRKLSQKVVPYLENLCE